VASSLPPTLGTAKKLRAYNQRASVRYRCPPASVGRVYVADDLEFQRAWLVNLSTTGIGLSLGKPLAVGLDVMIQVKSHKSKKNFGLPAHVIHCTQQASDWLVGCQFAHALTKAELEDLL
jgi:hypothetical protein